MADDFAGSTSTLGVVVVGASVSGNFETVGDRDWFRVSLKKGVTYQFVLSGSVAGGGTLTAPGPNMAAATMGVSSASASSWFNYTMGAPGGLPAVPFTPLADGDYLVKLTASTIGTYTLSASVVATDDFGDTIATVGKIAEGQVVEGSIALPNDRDWFRIELEPDTPFSMTLQDRNGNAGALALGLYDAAGNYLPPPAGVAVGTGVYSLTQATGASGTYFVQVRYGNGIGDYQLSVASVVDDIGASPATSSALAVGASATGMAEYLADSDWFKVELLAGEMYTFGAVSLAGGAAPGLSLYGADKSLKWSGTGVFAPYSSGSYYLQASALATGAYRVSASLQADGAGATLETAGVLQIGVRLAAKFEVTADQDWFRIPIQEGHFYRISATPTGVTEYPYSPYMNLPWENSPVRVLYAQTSAASTDMRALLSGEMLLRMSSGGMGAGSYSLLVTDLGADDHADSHNGATVLDFGTAATGTIEHAGDVDAFTYQLEAGVSYVFSASGTVASAGRLSMSFNDGGYQSGLLGRITPLTSGLYTIMAGGSQAGSYTLTPSRAVDDFGANGAAAGSIALSGSVQGELASADDRDWFGIDLVAGTTYWVEASYLGASYLASRGMVRVRDGAGAELATSPNWLLGATAFVPFVPAMDGRYYIETASSWLPGYSRDAIGRYTLGVKVGVADDVFGRAELAVGTAFQGKFETSFDTDTFLVSLEAGVYYQTQYTPLNGKGAAVAAGTLSFALADHPFASAIQTSSTGAIQVFQSGLYEVVLRAGTAVQYGLRLDRVGLDDQIGGVPLTLTTGVTSGAFEVAGDEDYFSFSVSAGQRLEFILQGAQSGAGTVDASRTAIQSYGSGAKAGFDGEQHLLLAATYTGRDTVTLRGNAAGTYSLVMVDHSADKVAPALMSSAIAIQYNEAIPLQFSEGVLGVSGLTLYDSKGGYTNLPSASNLASGATLHKPFYWLMPGETYTLKVAAGAFIDKASNPYAGSTGISVTVAQAEPGGTAGNDVFAANLTGKTINGGAGLDIALLAGRTQYTYKVTAPGTVQVSTYNNASDTLVGIERVYAIGGAAMAFDVAGNGVAGAAYRLYQAAFDRTPDKSGVGFWMSAMDKGMSLAAVAQGFVDSAEFLALYGAHASNRELVTRLYQNVLNRPGEASGIDFWTKALDAGVSRAEVLAGFSESPENVTFVAVVIGNGFEFIPYG